MAINKPRFNYARMRRFFYAWHGGMSSHLYAAASSGLVCDVEALQSELRKNAEWCEANPGAQPETRADAVYSRRVADALPLILTPVRVYVWCGREIQARALPWAEKD